MGVQSNVTCNKCNKFNKSPEAHPKCVKCGMPVVGARRDRVYCLSHGCLVCGKSLPKPAPYCSEHNTLYTSARVWQTRRKPVPPLSKKEEFQNSINMSNDLISFIINHAS